MPHIVKKRLVGTMTRGDLAKLQAARKNLQEQISDIALGLTSGAYQGASTEDINLVRRVAIDLDRDLERGQDVEAVKTAKEKLRAHFKEHKAKYISGAVSGFIITGLWQIIDHFAWPVHS